MLTHLILIFMHHFMQPYISIVEYRAITFYHKIFKYNLKNVRKNRSFFINRTHSLLTYAIEVFSSTSGKVKHFLYYHLSFFFSTPCNISNYSLIYFFYFVRASFNLNYGLRCYIKCNSRTS